MPACQWWLTNSRVSVRRGERRLFASRHATIDTGGVEWHLQIIPSIYLYVREKPVGRLPGDWAHPKTPGYHRGIPAGDVTPRPTPPHPRCPRLRGNQSCWWKPFTHTPVLMLHTDSCSRTVTRSARLLITELTHWAAMYFGPCGQNSPHSVAATELRNKCTW